MNQTVRILRGPTVTRLLRQGGAAGKSALAVAIEQGVVPPDTSEAEFAAWLSSSNAAAAESALAAEGSAESAQSARVAAEAARSGAEAAQLASQNARTAAETARDTAQGYSSAAQAHSSAAQGARSAAETAQVASQTASAAAEAARDAAGAASSQGGQLSTSLMSLDLVGIVDGLLQAMSVGPDGRIYLGKAEALRLLADRLETGDLVLQTRGLAEGARLTAPTSGPIGGVELAVHDAFGRLAASVLRDGSIEIWRAVVGNLQAEIARGLSFEVIDQRGNVVSRVRAAGTGAALALADQNGRAALAIDEGADVEMRYDAVLPYVGSKQCSNDSWLVVARVRSGSAPGLHDLYATNLTTGQEVQLTSDASDKADHLNPSIVGSHCVFTRRIGFRTQRLAVPLAGGSERPVFPERSIHVLGDSFVTPSFVTALMTGLADKRRVITTDGVGGSTLSQQLDRFLATPQFWDRTLIIMDGGLDSDQTTALAKVAALRDTLTPLVKRWIYVQPSPQEMWAGTPGRLTFDATVAALQAAFPNNYVECLTALKAANDGSANDLADVANDIVPRSLRIDPIHENATGTGVRCGQIAAFINGKGW